VHLPCCPLFSLTLLCLYFRVPCSALFSLTCWVFIFAYPTGRWLYFFFFALTLPCLYFIFADHFPDQKARGRLVGCSDGTTEYAFILFSLTLLRNYFIFTYPTLLCPFFRSRCALILFSLTPYCAAQLFLFSLTLLSPYFSTHLPFFDWETLV